MSFNHSVSDLVSRLRNGYMSGKPSISVPVSKLRESVLAILKDEGYILGYSKVQSGKFENFNVSLNYKNSHAAITQISTVSKPGRRVYTSHDDIPLVKNGLGMTIISSSQGVISDHQAREKKVGGEVLIKVF